jgi:hypothetical protein
MNQMMQTKPVRAAILAGTALLAAWIGGAGMAQADPAPYPTAAPMAAYRMANQADEIAMARSAAPPSISGDAQIMTLGAAGYETAVNGKNGFVCMVQRGWASEPDQPDFWNPKLLAPLCFNPAAARSVLPTYLERTRWVVAGATKAEVATRTKAEVASGKIGQPEAGAMSYMMSKLSYLGDSAGGHWHPHVMIYQPRGQSGPADWGANLAGSPIYGSGPGLDPAWIYFVLVTKWSDGTSAMAGR